MKNKAEVNYTVGEGEDAQEKTLIIRKPSAKQMRDAKVVYAREFNKALHDGAILEARLDEYMREQGVWGDEKQKTVVDVLTELGECLVQLETGGISKSKAKEVALRTRELRVDYAQIMGVTNKLKEMTAEGKADNEKFHYLASVCIYNEDGTSYFEDVDDYLNKGDEEHVALAAGELAKMEYSLDPDWEKNLPENEFLLKYKFVDADLNLVNKEGKRIDRNGDLINDDGMLVNEDGDLVDINGDVLDTEKKEPEFYDDDEDSEETSE